MSWVYNVVLRFLFRTPFRDVSTGLRLVRRAVLQDVELESTSPFIGAELAIKTMLKGYRVGEVGIQTFPRSFGRGSSTSIPNILATIARHVAHLPPRVLGRLRPAERPRAALTAG